MDEVAMLVEDERTKELVPILVKMSELETKLKEYKKIQESYDEFKVNLFNKMNEYGIKKFDYNGTQFTVVAASPDKTEIKLEFDVDSFKEEHPDLYKRFTKMVEKFVKGKASYLRITLPKESEEE